MKEIWKDIPGYLGKYEVSNLGRFRSKKNGILSDRKGKDGYLFTRLSLRGVKKLVVSHRIVAKVFIKNDLQKPQVNHKNFIKSDNRVSNLEWMTGLENTRHYLNSLKN